jgi:hypothetical protein
MTTLKRDIVKYIRDKAKSGYDKGSCCEICDETENLDFHHYYTVSLLVHAWVRKNTLDPEEVMEWREDFIEKHRSQLYDDAVTLCHTHHLKLHSIYGKNPNLGTAKKQQNWVSIQRDKHGVV